MQGCGSVSGLQNEVGSGSGLYNKIRNPSKIKLIIQYILTKVKRVSFIRSRLGWFRMWFVPKGSDLIFFRIRVVSRRSHLDPGQLRPDLQLCLYVPFYRYQQNCSYFQSYLIMEPRDMQTTGTSDSAKGDATERNYQGLKMADIGHLGFWLRNLRI